VFSQTETCFWRQQSSLFPALRVLVHVPVFHSSRLLVCQLALTVRYSFSICQFAQNCRTGFQNFAF